MANVQQTLVIAGAAEGSWYTIGGDKKDLRYKATFASPTSGLSFGVFQFDAATNPGEAGSALRCILFGAVQAGNIDQKTSDRLFGAATRVNAGAWFSKHDHATMDDLLGLPASRSIIDVADKQRAGQVEAWIDGIIADAAAFWLQKRLSSPLLSPGGAGNLRLFAYLLACLNKRPNNEDVFRGWLRGDVEKTLKGPAGGFHLTAPPTLDQMHAFLSSLRIWTGTNGRYSNLRGRLDPVLDAMGA